MKDRRLEFEQQTRDRRLEFEQQTKDLYHREARKHSPVGSIVGVDAGSIVGGRRMEPNEGLAITLSKETALQRLMTNGNAKGPWGEGGGFRKNYSPTGKKPEYIAAPGRRMGPWEKGAFDFCLSTSIPVLATSTYVVAWPPGDQSLGGDL